MEMTGQQRIAAPLGLVWDALNDPDTLRQCIPGCQSLEKIADDRMRATAAVKIGPIGAKFTGEVILSELDPPNGYKISGEGGGTAGSAKGGAKVRLIADGPDATLLDYTVEAEVGGKIAQLGGALIDASAKQMAGQFFRKFAKVLAERESQPPAIDVVAPPAQVAKAVTVTAAATTTTPSPLAWAFAVLCAALLGFVLGRQAAGWDSAGAWPGLAIGLAFVVVAGAGFALGRQGPQGTGR